MTSAGVAPTEMTFGILLDVCNSSCDLERARALFADVRGSGLCLNVVHYTTFMKVEGGPKRGLHFFLLVSPDPCELTGFHLLCRS